MRHALLLTAAASLLIPGGAGAQQEESYDYWPFNRAMVRRGQEAVMTCNGLFASNRTLEQVKAQELAFLPNPASVSAPGDVVIDRDRKAIAVGAYDGVPVIRAAFREGLGCVVLSPDQTFDDIDGLPRLGLPAPPGDPTTIPWPNGDLVEERALPPNVDAAALEAASDWAFERESPEQVTIGLVVVHQGKIIHERYAPGVNATTKTRTWSVAKSIAATLIGMNVDAGRMSLDDPLPFDWLPEARAPDKDPRSAITLRHALNMSTGLYPIDNAGLEYATGSGLSYWAGASSVTGARSKALIREPGTHFDYENYDTLLAIYAMKLALGDEKSYLEFPRRALLDRIGMRSTLLGVDRFGDYILSSQVYATARDLARLGLLYLRDGVWEGERLLSREWIDFVRTPAPATAETGNQYGGHFWLVPDNRSDVPTSAYSMSGNRGQSVTIIPSHDLVIVRRGLDYGRQGFDRWGLAREVLGAVSLDWEH